MNYDIVNGGYYDNEYEEIKFFTIGDLIDVCNRNPEKVVRFLGTVLSIGELCSWRGSYDIPCITPEYEDKTGKQIAEELEKALKEIHVGYKGGNNKYYPEDEFYVASYGSAAEYKVVKAELEEIYGDEILVLYTKLDPY